MKSLFSLGIFVVVMFFVYDSYADVKINGDIVIQNSSVGAIFMGEIINDTNTTVKNVKITITCKDSLQKVISTDYTYVDGYNATDPSEAYNTTYIPVNKTAPFLTYADVDSSKIASFSYIINYEATSQSTVNPDVVNLPGGLQLSQSSLGIEYFGEIFNNSKKNIYFVKITVVSKDNNGRITDVDFTYADGEDYLVSGMHTDTRISPGGFAPFWLPSFVSPQKVTSTYYIINYREGEEGIYRYDDSQNVQLVGDINKVSSAGMTKFLGEIRNNTLNDIYFVKISIVSKNKEGKIIDISYSYVNGTNFTLYKDLITDTHISPKAIAPFEVIAFVKSDEIVSYYYRINYEFKEALQVQEQGIPALFALQQNYPNPFNPSTTIECTVNKTAPVELVVFNVAGQKIAVLHNGLLSSGKHSFIWNAQGMPTGIYIYTLKTGGRTESKRMLVMK